MITSTELKRYRYKTSYDVKTVLHNIYVNSNTRHQKLKWSLRSAAVT